MATIPHSTKISVVYSFTKITITFDNKDPPRSTEAVLLYTGWVARHILANHDLWVSHLATNHF